MQFGRIHHVGVLVADLELSAAFLESTFGFGRVNTVVLDDLLGWFFRAGDVTVELVWLRDAETRTARLEGRPALLEHVAVEVDDLAEAIASLRAAGVTVSDPPLVTTAYATVFTEAATSGGVRYQLIEPRP